MSVTLKNTRPAPLTVPLADGTALEFGPREIRKGLPERVLKERLVQCNIRRGVLRQMAAGGSTNAEAPAKRAKGGSE